MNDLITVNYETKQPTVSGRELHEALAIETPYHKWFPRMCEYGFTEGEDFNSDKNVRVQIEGSREVQREIIDHQLTIPMAKEICMLQRNEKGKMFRQYFIKVEEAWNSPEMIMKRALEFANKRVEELKRQTLMLTETNSHLTSELDVYTKETSVWEDRAIINALTRAYAANAYPNDHYQFSKAWAEVYRNFEYKMNVSVSIRQAKDKGKKKKNKLDYLTPKELKNGCKIVDAMCRQIGINTGKIINEVNKSAIAG